MMRQTLTVIFFLGYWLQVFSQQVQFQRVYGGNGYDTGCEIIQMDDDGYLIAGSSGSFDFDVSGQILLLRTDELGYVQWRRTYGGRYSDKAETMQLTSDDFVLIGGYTETVDHSYQMKVWKFTLEGDTVWSKEIGGADWELGKQLVALPDGGCAFIGTTYSYGEGNGDFFLVRLDSEGDTLWTKTYGGTGEESGESIALASDGGFFLGGITESFGAGKKDMYIIKTNAFGDTVWTKTYGGEEDDMCYGVAEAIDGGYVFVGGTYSNTAGKSDFYLRKDGGNQHWTRIESKPGDNFLTDVIVEPVTGWVAVTGYGTEGTDFGGEDFRIIRFDANSNWNGVAKFHGSEGDERPYDIKRTSDHGYVMVGVSNGFMERFDDVYVVKTDSIGFSVPPTLGVNEVDLEGKTFGVTIGPNPISYEETATLFIQNYDELKARVDGQLQLQIFNAVGQLVSQTPVTSGNRSLWRLNFQAGIYQYRLVSDNGTLATGKLVKLN